MPALLLALGEALRDGEVDAAEAAHVAHDGALAVRKREHAADVGPVDERRGRDRRNEEHEVKIALEIDGVGERLHVLVQHEGVQWLEARCDGGAAELQRPERAAAAATLGRGGPLDKALVAQSAQALAAALGHGLVPHRGGRACTIRRRGGVLR